jgi:phage regulator Rha-like protein
MTNLVHTSLEVQEREGVLVVDSRLIAERLGIQHKNFLDTIHSHKDSIEAVFGTVAFETRPSIDNLGRANTPIKIALLTEEQATALMTLSRNTPQVVELKLNLVKAFSEARKARSTVLVPHSPLEILQLAVTQMVEQNQKLNLLDQSVVNHETRLARLEHTTQQTGIAPDFYTVSGWARRCGTAITHEKALKYGRKAASLSKANGVMVSKIADAKYGQVNAYHADILRVVFSQAV